MRSTLVFFLATFLISTSADAVPASADGHRIVGLLEYIGADYGEAVDDGEIANEFEFVEMKELSEAAAELAEPTTYDDLQRSIAKLRSLIDAKADVAEVRTQTAAARALAVERFGISLAPPGPPDFERGKRLYAAHCVSCHAADGSADVEIAKTLEPRPANFTDPERRAQLSPYRAFNTITFGVEGTSMAAYPKLTDAQRWDLAFYVLALGHGAKDSAGEPIGETAMTLTDLATSKDAELAASGATDAELTALRTAAPFGMKTDEVAPGSAIAIASRYLDEAERSMAAGEFEEARKAVLASYLEGFELVESSLDAKSPEHRRAVEAEYLELRESLGDADAARAGVVLTELREQLESTDRLLAEEKSSWGIGVASAFIALREGVEIVLLLALLLGVVRRVGREEATRYVHAGWIAAIVAGVGTWFAATHLIEISGAGRELLEGVVALIAAAVLFSVSYWFVGKMQGDRWTTFIKAQLSQRLTSGRLLSFTGIAFLAVYREAFETVLFYQALVLEADGQLSPILAGAAVAGILLAAFALSIFKLGAKLPLKQFFAASAAGLYALCVILVGSGLHALVEAGTYDPVGVPAPTVPLLGLYPDLVSIGAQALLVAAAAAWFAGTFKHRPRPS